MTYDPSMAEYDADFDNAEIPEDVGFREVPKGTYQARIDEATFDQPDWADYPRLNLKCVICGGEYAGSVVFAGGDVNPEYIHYLKGTLVKLGFNPPPRPSEIRGRLKEMLDRIIEVYVGAKKEGKKYAPVYVNRLLKEAGDTSGDEPPPHDDSDMLF